MSMQMTLVDQLKQTRTPQEALLLLAEAVDALNARASTADPWEQPLTWDFHAEQGRVAVAHLDKQEEIAEVQARIATETDPAEHKALKAKLWLLQNPGGIIEHGAAEGKRTKVDGDAINLPPPSEQRQVARGLFARQARIAEFLQLPEEDVIEAFKKGGGRWLYYDNREAVMEMPMPTRQWLVADIMEDSPAEAAEVGRDILKIIDSTPLDNALSMFRRAQELEGGQ